MNRKLAKKAAEKKRLESKRQALRRQEKTEWRPRDEQAPVVEVNHDA